MIALITKSTWTRFGALSLLFFVLLSLNATQATAQESRKVIITTKKIDKNGKETIQTIEKTGTDASDEAIDKIIEQAKKDGKSIDVEMEYTFDTKDTEIKKLLDKHGASEDDEDIEMEISIDEDGNVSKKIVKKEVRIIKKQGDEDIDLGELQEEHSIEIDGEGKKEIRIIQMAGDENEEINIDELLKEHGIDVNGKGKKEIRIIKIEGDEDLDIEELLQEHGIDKEEKRGEKVRIIKMKGEKGKDKKRKGKTKIVQMDGDKVIEIEEENDVETMIFQDESGKKTIIKKEVHEVIKWTQREDIEEKLEKMGIHLKTPPPPLANYVNAVVSNQLVFMAGKGPAREDGTNITGKVGKDLSVEEGYEAARRAGIAQLAALKAEIGDLNRVKRIVKVLGMVNATADFTEHSQVINGFSDLMVEVFGDRGKHARAAVGMYSLPKNIAVEVEMVVEIE